MGKFIEKRNGVNIFEYDAPQYRGKAKIDSITADGMRFRLYKWLHEECVYEDIRDVESVAENTSGIREGNEVQIYDDYRFDDTLWISYLYYYNGTVWAVLYDKANDRWYGEFEL